MAAATSRRLSRAEIADVMRRAGWPESAIPVGVAIALAESGGNPRAVNTKNRNGSRDYGLFQINTVHGSLLKQGDWSDPVDNAKMALKVYRDSGSKWRPWATYNSGSYRKFFTSKPGGNPTLAVTPPDNDKGFTEGLVDGITGAAPVGANLFTLGFIGTAAFWQRFGIALLAVLLIIVGVWIVFRQPLTDLGKGLINLTPQGRVASVAGGLAKGTAK